MSSTILNLNCCIESFYIDIMLKKKKVYNTITIPCEKSKIVSIAFLVMKSIVATWSRFPVKLIYCIAFGSVLSGSCLVNSIAILLYYSLN